MQTGPQFKMKTQGEQNHRPRPSNTGKGSVCSAPEGSTLLRVPWPRAPGQPRAPEKGKSSRCRTDVHTAGPRLSDLASLGRPGRPGRGAEPAARDARLRCESVTAAASPGDGTAGRDVPVGQDTPRSRSRAAGHFHAGALQGKQPSSPTLASERSFI